MKLLRDILYKVGLVNVIGKTNVAIEKVSFDSRQVSKFTAFVAVRGTQTDGHEYINTAIEKGATAIICEDLPEDLDEKITYVKVENSAKALGCMASNFFDNPSTELKLVGVTGTNGKTTTVTLLHDLFEHLGKKSGLLSTVVNKISSVEVKATHTTPDPVQLNDLLRQMVSNGCDYCFMEVSSHAIAQYRIEGLDFAGGIFSNITHDHIDYHGSFNDYIKAKKAFFDILRPSAFALFNKDDKHALTMIEDCAATHKSYALKSMADFKTKIIETSFLGMQLEIDQQEVWTKLIGEFNAYNLTAVYAAAVMLEMDKLEILTAISDLKPVPGRFEYVKSPSNISGIVDYAHTPDALENVLKTIHKIRTGNETLITVVGCGGDRDKEKRPLMAAIACKYSDQVILTSDNPRSEDPEQIINDMRNGIDPVNSKKVLAITNREEAIKTAISLAQENDIALIAGKGHEKYQEINGVKHSFDDLKILKKTLKNS